MNKFYKIDRHSCYVSTYWLNNKRLMTGEKLEVQFHDGSTAIGKIRIHEDIHEGRGGMDETSGTHIPMFPLMVRGHNLEIELNGAFWARRIKE